MRSIATAWLGAWMLLTATASITPASEKPQIFWQRDYKKAATEAHNLARPVLIYFSAKWCPSCLRVERTVFVDKQVVQFVSTNVVAVRVDADAASELTDTWKIERLPTALLVSADGREQGRIEGYRPADQYLSALSTLVQNATGSARTNEQSDVHPANHSITDQQAQQKLDYDDQIELASRNAARAAGPVEVVLTIEEIPNLALDGACLVSMLENHKVVMGDPQFSLEFDGSTYWFAGSDELDRFQADPARYTPGHSGFCPASLIDDGCEVRGNVHHAAIYRNRLYVFAGAEQRKRFQVNPKRYCESDLNNSDK